MEKVEPTLLAIADVLHDVGYDYHTALDVAQQTILEFRVCDETQHTYHIGSRVFTLRKGSN